MLTRMGVGRRESKEENDDQDEEGKRCNLYNYLTEWSSMYAVLTSDRRSPWHYSTYSYLLPTEFYMAYLTTGLSSFTFCMGI